MLSELLQKLESEHGIPTSQGHDILNTIAMHIKEKFPMVGGMIDNLFGTETVASAKNIDPEMNTQGENSLQQLEDLAKSKLGGLFGK